MEYPQELLRDIYWSFANEQFDNETDFFTELTAYYKAISGKAFPIKANNIIFSYPKIVIQYMQYNYNKDDYDEPQKEFTADNGTGFTVSELLFKIHSTIGVELQDEDNCYFEGLAFATLDDPDFENIPVYFLDTGS